ncbi:hypothetical protein AGDE_00384 [Angomonas deanei]|nr:hypothetical protein AGDE_00384 [Angomonas deanei]|eukprot:EPY43537.1 hypothetical protein AGDE_00384 [Angomonas deanei]
MGEMMAVFDGYEILLSLLTVVIVLLYSIERYYTVNHLLVAKNNRVKRMDEGLPPPMPMEVDEATKDLFRDAPQRRELAADTQRIKQESFHRRATQRKFEDFREYIFVMDPDGVANRKVSTMRFSYQYLNEKEIPKKCPITLEINSDEKEQSYDAIEPKLLDKIAKTQWASPDVGYASTLVAKGLSRIPANSTTPMKWTFIEYTDFEKGKKDAKPMCIAAIHNNRFEDVGMCQRVIITGKPDLKPELYQKRQEDLKSGKISKKSLVSGGYLTVKELSTPLKDMKL